MGPPVQSNLTQPSSEARKLGKLDACETFEPGTDHCPEWQNAEFQTKVVLQVNMRA